MSSTNIRFDEASPQWPLALYLLRRADEALILGHRLSEWTGHGPMLEEELALANIALDLVGQARALYGEVGAITGHSEDELAYLRDARQWRNCLLVEQPNGDFAMTMVRQLLYSAAIDPFWQAAVGSAHPMLAAIAAKAEKESRYHLRHASEWAVRLGDGTEESHRRAAAALVALWPFVEELFEIDAVDEAMVAQGIAPDPRALRVRFDMTVDEVLERATLVQPEATWRPSGGRRGLHTEALGYLLAEMQYLQRSYPGAVW